MAATPVSASDVGHDFSKISWICEFRVIMDRMTGLLERCLWGTLGFGANTLFAMSTTMLKNKPTQPQLLPLYNVLQTML